MNQEIASPETTCVNCETIVTSAFCPNCGQRKGRKRITLLGLYHDFQSRIYGFDGMFPRTMKDLTLRPGQVARSFIDGNRVKYVGPVGYFFLMVTMFLLLMDILSIDFYTYANANNPMSGATNGTPQQQEVTRRFMEIIFKNFRIFTFILIPITGLWARVFFRKAKLNWMEHMVPVFYVQGHMMWITLINIGIFFFFSWSLNFYELFMTFAFYGFACLGLYNYQSKLKAFLKGILIAIISFVSYQLFVVIVTIIMAIVDPEIRELFKPPQS